MKKLLTILSSITLISCSSIALISCNSETDKTEDNNNGEEIDVTYGIFEKYIKNFQLNGVSENDNIYLIQEIIRQNSQIPLNLNPHIHPELFTKVIKNDGIEKITVLFDGDSKEYTFQYFILSDDVNDFVNVNYLTMFYWDDLMSILKEKNPKIDDSFYVDRHNEYFHDKNYLEDYIILRSTSHGGKAKIYLKKHIGLFMNLEPDLVKHPFPSISGPTIPTSKSVWLGFFNNGSGDFPNDKDVIARIKEWYKPKGDNEQIPDNVIDNLKVTRRKSGLKGSVGILSIVDTTGLFMDIEINTGGMNLFFQTYQLT